MFEPFYARERLSASSEWQVGLAREPVWKLPRK